MWLSTRRSKSPRDRGRMGLREECGHLTLEKITGAARTAQTGDGCDHAAGLHALS